MPPSAPVTTTVLPPVAAAPDAIRGTAEEKEHTEGRPISSRNTIAMDDLRVECNILPLDTMPLPIVLVQLRWVRALLCVRCGAMYICAVLLFKFQAQAGRSTEPQSWTPVLWIFTRGTPLARGWH